MGRYPDMPVCIAAKASSAIPLIFQPVAWGENALFIDGGLEGNLPVEAFQHNQEEAVLAFNLVANEGAEKPIKGSPKSFGQFLQVSVMMLKEAAQGKHGVDTLNATGA